MLGERDRASSRGAMSPPSSSPPLFSTTQRASSLDSSFGKSESLEPGNPSDVMATRGASLAAQEEPEQEQELGLRPENKKPEALKTDVHVIKRRNVGVPKFLRFLFQILDVEDPEVITWSHDGTAFQIIQPEELANQILPKYFKHNKVSSFQRQLNYFGFKKWTKTQTNTCTFSHPFFLRADKERMKFIKRKERANPAVMSAAMAAAISSNPIHLMNQMQIREREQFEARDLAEARSQLPTQQALKRQKSNTLSGATVTFLNSAAAGRRHSTGMLPGSEAFGMAAAAAAAAAAATASGTGRKRAGTPAEQELELEMEARADAMANVPSAQQQLVYLRKIAENRELGQRYPYQSSRRKRQSLPHVLPPGMGEQMGMGMAMSMPNSAGNGGFAPRGGVYLGRRRSDQLLTDFNIGNKAPTISQLEDFMSSSATSSQQTIFASSMKNDASVVLPISSMPLAQDSYQLHQQQHQQQQQQQIRQQMSRQQNVFGGSGYGSLKSNNPSSGWSPSIKTESCGGWPTSINVNSSSATSASYPPPQQNHSMMSFKFGDPNTPQKSMLSFQGGVGSLNYSHPSSGGEQKLQQRQLMSHSQMYQSQQQRIPSYQQQQDQEEQAESNQPRDYIDVLLESAGLDDNLPPQTSTTLPSESWNESSFGHPQQGQSRGPYSFMQSQEQGQQELQMSPMGMPHHPNQRF